MSLTTQALMKEHFEHATAIRDALTTGKLVDVDPHAQWLADYEGIESLDDAWRPHMRAMMESATVARDAKGDPERIATAVSTMAQACGACHAAVGGPTSKLKEMPPPSDNDIALHRWAADRMWDGLVTPSDEDWKTGAAALTRAKLVNDDEIPADEREEVDALQEQVRNLAMRAANARRTVMRVRMYAELVQTCSSCHDAAVKESD